MEPHQTQLSIKSITQTNRELLQGQWTPMKNKVLIKSDAMIVKANVVINLEKNVKKNVVIAQKNKI